MSIPRQHQGNNPLILALRVDGNATRLPSCERFQVIFDTTNAADSATVNIIYNGVTNQPIAQLGPAPAAFISDHILYPGPDAYVQVVGPPGTRALILTSGNQWQGAE